MSILRRIKYLPSQILRKNPFSGSMKVVRLPVLETVRVTARFFRNPLKILDYVFQDDQDLKFFDLPGFNPILFIRDPEMIRQITLETANGGDFDRDTLPTQGIGRVVGKNNLLYAQGELWQRHKSGIVRVLGTKAVQTYDVFHNLENTIRTSLEPQISELEEKVRISNSNEHSMHLENDIKALMLNLLVNVMFGAKISQAEICEKYLPAIENVIHYIMLDTVANPFRLPVFKIPSLTRKHARLKQDRRIFEELVERVIASRDESAGFWPMLIASGSDDAIKSNVRVFLAGALEATASYISWTLLNLGRDPEAQEKAYQEALGCTEMAPAARVQAVYLQKVMLESLRLNNALYFLPRIVLKDTSITTNQGTIHIPSGTHLVLATYHTNRSEKYWGKAATGFPATQFAPDRWNESNMKAFGRSTKDNLHFGFGHGPRVCIGKHFSEAEAFVCLTLFLKRFQFRSVDTNIEADSGVSTRPMNKVHLVLTIRKHNQT